MDKSKILIVDDNEDVLFALNLLLKNRVQAVRVATNPERVEHFMNTFQPDVILLDMNFTADAISGQEGMDCLQHIINIDNDAVVVFMTAYSDTEKAVRAIKAGATDFISKPWENDKLLATLQAAVELRRSKQEVKSLKEKVAVLAQQGSSNTPILIGESAAMKQVKSIIDRIAETDANVLITGENGTGKDVVAHLIKHLSNRSNQPFVSIDLGSLPEQLFESELFGYEKGAFTSEHTLSVFRSLLFYSSVVFCDSTTLSTCAAGAITFTTVVSCLLPSLSVRPASFVPAKLDNKTEGLIPKLSPTPSIICFNEVVTSSVIFAALPEPYIVIESTFASGVATACATSGYI